MLLVVANKICSVGVCACYKHPILTVTVCI